MLHQRHNISERFVERQHVDIGRLVETAMHAVENRMGRFMRHDVMRQARVNHATGDMVARVARGCLEVTEQQRNFLRTVKSVRLPQSMRPNDQLANELTVV